MTSTRTHTNHEPKPRPHPDSPEGQELYSRRRFLAGSGATVLGLLGVAKGVEVISEALDGKDGVERLRPETVRTYAFGDMVTGPDGEERRLGSSTVMADQWFFDVTGPEGYDDGDVHALTDLIQSISDAEDNEGRYEGASYRIGLMEEGSFHLESLNGVNSGNILVGPGD